MNNSPLLDTLGCLRPGDEGGVRTPSPNPSLRYPATVEEKCQGHTQTKRTLPSSGRTGAMGLTVKINRPLRQLQTPFNTSMSEGLVPLQSLCPLTF
ncbi:hypothetical protein AAFF_G00204540 [Aldrovandia affinis]|uniref:Uncharacterized protein n=1 Tax=Aldrovandia affinis TaxID=143900 RepID=A0AAD7W6E2_9TELE|nr:hypothetical protein AAFF_G00204540 [Aldrovandia affinis]